MPDNIKSMSLRSWWTMEKYSTGASAWVSDSAIPAPGNVEILETRIGTTENVITVNGSLGRITRSTTYNLDQMLFQFHKSTVKDSLVAQFETYKKDDTGIRITTHVANKKFEGYVENVTKMWDLSYKNEEQEYALEVLFQPFDVDGDGTIG